MEKAGYELPGQDVQRIDEQAHGNGKHGSLKFEQG